MASDDAPSDGAESPLIVLRVVIRSPDVDTFVQKYSRFLKDDRIFIFTKASQPPGTRVRFTLELADGPSLIQGEGVVTRVRADQGDPSKPPGMELRFTPVDDKSRAMIDRMLQTRNIGLASQPIAIHREPTPPPHPLDDASTKIRTGQDALPLHTPSAGTALPPPPPALPPPPVVRASPPEERTDVDAAGADANKFRAMPPAFTTTPTPLPAPLPLPTIMTPPHGLPAETTGSSPAIDPGAPKREQPVTLSTPQLPPLAPTPLFGVAAIDDQRDDAPGAFAHVDGAPAPRFAESYVGPLPPPPGAPPAANGGTVPANPFAEVSDQAIEYFVSWSLEQSTAAKPASSASFANVPMKPPRQDRPPGAGMRLAIGILIGLALGIPLGAVGMWTFRPGSSGPEMAFVPSLARSRAAAPPATTKPPETKAPTKAATKPSQPAEAAATAKHDAEPAHATAATHEATSSKKSDTEAAQTKPAMAANAHEPPANAPSKSATASTAPKSATASTAPKNAAAKTATTTAPAPTASPAANAGTPGAPSTSASAGEAAASPTPTSAAPTSAPAHASAADERPAADANELPAPPSLTTPHHGKTATLRIRSTPPGADVTVKGEPHGPTPVDVELPPNHRYEIVVTTPGKPPWKKRINLKPPLTEVTATFH